MKDCCEKPDIRSAKHKDVLFCSYDEGNTADVNIDIRLTWCNNCRATIKLEEV